MTKLQKKFMILYLVLTVTLITAVGCYLFYVMLDFSKKEIKGTVNSKILQAQSLVERKIAASENYFNILMQNKEIYDLLTQKDWQNIDGDFYLNSLKLDKELSKIFYATDKIVGCVFYPKNGGQYIFSTKGRDFCNLITDDWRQKVKNSTGEIVWFGHSSIKSNDNITDDYFAAGRRFRTFGENNFFVDCGEMYIFYDLADFIPADIQNIADEENLIFYNANNEIMFSSLNTKDYDLIHKAISELPKNGETYLYSNTNKILVSSELSPLVKWRFVYVKRLSSFLGDMLIIMIIMIVILLLAVIIVNMIFYYEGKRMFAPIADIMAVMGEIGKNNFDVHVECEADGELGVICDGINKMSVELKKAFERSIMIEKQKKIEQIRALQYQINPHFLYNTLASLKMNALINNVMPIADNIEALSRLLRNTLSNSDELITVENEINNVKDYVLLQQFRYKDGIKSTFYVDESIKNFGIPNLIIQPIVENAIMHGLSEKINKGELACLIVSAEKFEDEIRIIICDNGVGMDAEKNHEKNGIGNGIALSNVNDRIKLIFGDAYGISVDSKIGKYTKVTILIPQVNIEGE